MRKYYAVLTVILMLFAVSAFSQEIVKEMGVYKTTITKEFNVSSGGKLMMSRITGDVKITSWEKNQVQIIEELRMEVFTEDEARKIVEHTLSTYQQSGNSVIVEGTNGKDWIRRNFMIQVPKAFSVDVYTKGGDISVKDLRGAVGLKTSGGDIEVEQITGDVTVNTSGGDLELAHIRGKLIGRTSGGDIGIEHLEGRGNVNTSGGSIEVVDASDQLALSTSGGDIDVVNVKGDLKANTSGGTIKIVNCSGRADVHTSGGDIILKTIQGSLKGHTSGGDIEGSTLKETIDVHTSGGDIELADVQAATVARTSGGDIELELTLTDFNKPHSLDLSTSSGNITVTLPAKLPASIDAAIELGRSRRYLTRYDIYSDFPLSKERVDEDGNQIIRSTGDINGGGDKIKLRTSAGEIRIQKSR